jgi:hypothetical protein
LFRRTFRRRGNPAGFRLAVLYGSQPKTAKSFIDAANFSCFSGERFAPDLVSSCSTRSSKLLVTLNLDDYNGCADAWSQVRNNDSTGVHTSTVHEAHFVYKSTIRPYFDDLQSVH